jgi:hypothetical protein
LANSLQNSAISCFIKIYLSILDLFHEKRNYQALRTECEGLTMRAVHFVSDLSPHRLDNLFL